jgi:hypothetical protein
LYKDEVVNIGLVIAEAAALWSIYGTEGAAVFREKGRLEEFCRRMDRVGFRLPGRIHGYNQWLLFYCGVVRENVSFGA